MKWLKHILTEPDNETTCPVRVAYFMVFMVFIGVSAWNIQAVVDHLDAWTTSALKIIAAALTVVAKDKVSGNPQ
jgi:hypothetical protein